jgi:hypothetical protein
MVETEKEVFLAWCGELLFFTLIGLAIAFVSLEMPEDPMSKAYRDRAQIFLGGKDPLPDGAETFLLARFREVGAFCEKASWEIDIEDYDETSAAYKVRAKTDYLFRNPIRDQSAQFDVSYGFRPDRFKHLSDDAEVGRYTSICIDGADQLRGRGPVKVPQAGFSDKLQIVIPPGGTLLLETAYTVLMAANEEQRIRPQRFVQLFQVKVTNRSSVAPKLTAAPAAGGEGPEEARTLFFARPYQPHPIQGVAPGEVAFTFRLGAPE